MLDDLWMGVDNIKNIMKMMLKINQLIILSLFFSEAYFSPILANDQPASKTSGESDFVKQSSEELKYGIEQKHPAAYYILASKLFEEGKKDEAVFWFYAGQLRFRFHLEANHRNLDPSGDPALFSSFSEVIGRPLNEYAFGDLSQLAKTIDEVLKWDETHENGFTSKITHLEAYKRIRDGLAKMREYVFQNQDEIKRQRTVNGLENR